MSFVYTKLAHQFLPSQAVARFYSFNDKSFPRNDIDLADVGFLTKSAGGTHKVNCVVIVSPVQSKPILTIEHGVESLIVGKSRVVKLQLFWNGLVVEPHKIIHEHEIHLFHGKRKKL